MAGTQMQLEDWLDDLCVRFIINLPQEDLSSVARICFQVEEAQWFYEDFIRPLDPTLPSMSLRTFCLRIFQHCPLLASFSVENHTKAFEEFLQYKTRVPVRGAIMLNHAMDSVVLVKGWKKGANWSFPRGKINKDEGDLDCAIREVYEETGLDIRAAGLAPTEKKPKYIEILMREQQLRLYVFRGIPTDTKFQPRTRKEISKIEWYKLSELPAFRKKGAQNQNESGASPAHNKFYMVAPFLVPLKKWIHTQKKMDERRTVSGAHHPHQHLAVDEVATTEDDTWAPVYTEQQSYVPAIDTLDGATRELQRLLKMQPPTQGIQPQPHEDKGSALLSILQSSNPRPRRESHQADQATHTPLGSTIPYSTQPFNPHHRNNLNTSHPLSTQQPPPPFPLATDQGAAPWILPSNSANEPQNHLQFFQELPIQQQQQQRQFPLPQPQPLSTAAQTTAPSSGVFQGQFAPPGDNIPMPNVLPSQAPFPGPTNQPPPSAPGSAKLSGASLALLNAFKRDAGPPPPKQADQISGAVQGIPASLQSSPYMNQAIASGPATLMTGEQTRRQQEQAKVSELVGSSTRPVGTQHRSALLDMFKKSPSNAVIHPVQGGAKQHHQPTTNDPHTSQSKQAENTLLRQLQGNQGPGSQKLSMEQLSIQPSPAQLSNPYHGGENIRPYQPDSYHHAQRLQQPPHQQQPAGPPSGIGHGQPAQPARILQRGQPPESFHAQTAQPSGTSYQTSPFMMQHVPQSFQPAPAPGAPTTDANHRVGGAIEQQKQLLSLFGKQEPSTNIAPVSVSDQGDSGEFPRSRVASVASRGGETPISPAEQTFLLGYLQSVTNTAGRR